MNQIQNSWFIVSTLDTKDKIYFFKTLRNSWFHSSKFEIVIKQLVLLDLQNSWFSSSKLDQLSRTFVLHHWSAICQLVRESVNKVKLQKSKFSVNWYRSWQHVEGAATSPPAPDRKFGALWLIIQLLAKFPTTPNHSPQFEGEISSGYYFDCNFHR